MNDDRIIDVEAKLAYLEDSVQTLNDVITRQQSEIDRLSARCARLEEQLNAVDAPTEPEDERPPHY